MTTAPYPITLTQFARENSLRRKTCVTAINRGLVQVPTLGGEKYLVMTQDMADKLKAAYVTCAAQVAAERRARILNARATMTPEQIRSALEKAARVKAAQRPAGTASFGPWQTSVERRLAQLETDMAWLIKKAQMTEGDGK